MSKVNRVQDPNIFRSEKMSFIRLYVENDAAHDTVLELGKIGAIEFQDLNKGVSTFQRTFATEVNRCEQMERILRIFRGHILKEGIPINPNLVNTQNLNDMEILLQEGEKEVVESSRHYSELQASLNSCKQRLQVLQITNKIYNFESSSEVSRSIEEGLGVTGITGIGKVGHICGAIDSEKAELFSRVVFRVSRGNCVVEKSPIGPVQNPNSKLSTDRTAFMVFFSSSNIEKKVVRAAEAFGASVYHFPDTAGERSQIEKSLNDEIAELTIVMKKTQSGRLDLLKVLAQSLVAQESVIKQEKAIYHILNLFSATAGRRSMEAQGWCATNSLPDIRQAIHRVGHVHRMPAPILDEIDIATVSDDPPTYFKTNKLTSGFQAIVDAYGVAGYQELNPTPFTVITFPFLFAVMFGDFGHGCLMFLFALFLVFSENYFIKNPPGEIFGICFGGRYVILLMSLFSMYTGLIYNDTFALSFDLFGSAYTSNCLEKVNGTCTRYGFANYDFIHNQRCANGEACVPIYHPDSYVYPFGIDPIWKQSENELPFTNSLKMKLSIVLGVTQMEFGILLGGMNHIYFRNWIAFFNEFIPQIVFLSSIFGYMVFVMFLKWTTYYPNTHCSPSILTTFIDMFLGFGTINSEPGCEEYSTFFSGQSQIEQVLILVAFLSVPWMLVTKPILMNRKYNKLRAGFHKVEGEESHEEGQVVDRHMAHFDFAEEMVHQMIHTIEFVLGAVSNTASYLRLWALSLAHAQLSTVFWEKVMVDQLASGKPYTIVPAFMVWLCCTFAVLMVMESLSAFLHALRLHWVEFQSKFYQGSGRKFQPFSFNFSKSEE
eukprot:c17311_g1_i1.p1 GENE.c17311_g1_i1~~c17311_g1_i1.p1  ORF type:complete len:828 (+),score=288.33 c17311_g1_i1:52-2535(+)